MSRTLRHRNEDWEAQGTGTGIATGFGNVVPDASNWGITFTCVSNPRIGSFQGSLVSTAVADISSVPEADLRQSLDAAISDAKEKVIRSLEDQKWDWRTVEGVAKDAGLSSGAVSYILESDPDTFIRSRVPDKDGRPLYSTRDHYALKRGFLDRLRST